MSVYEKARLARQAGQNKRNAGFQRSVTTKVLVAAVKRGWSATLIAHAAGVSLQSISNRIRRYETKHGPIARLDTKISSHSKTTQPWRCAVCGRQQWDIPSRIHDGYMICGSGTCFMEMKRQITDRDVETAIDARWAGRSWASISLEMSYSIQAIQQRIWKYLYLIKMLDKETVMSIWSPDSGTKYSWKWLEISTGLVCTETGARVDVRGYGRSHLPWGSKIVRDS